MRGAFARSTTRERPACLQSVRHPSHADLAVVHEGYVHLVQLRDALVDP